MGTEIALDPVQSFLANRLIQVESPSFSAMPGMRGYPQWQPEVVIRARRCALSYYALRWQRVMRGNVIGPMGPTMQFSPQASDAVIEEWQRFTQMSDPNGLPLATTLGAAYQAYLRDGDCMQVMTPDEADDGRLMLQQADALALANVETDAYGRVTGFRLIDDTLVPPADVMYFWQPEYMAYYRGYPRILLADAALQKSHDYGVWFEADAHLTAILRAILKISYQGAQSAQSEARVRERAREMKAAGDTRSESR